LTTHTLALAGRAQQQRREPMPNARKQWDFDPKLKDPHERMARALEYIAHYLDRIDGHLGKITSDYRKANTAYFSGVPLAKRKPKP
jgi:hypothetical protein